MEVVQIFSDGNVFSPSILDIEEEVLIKGFMSGVNTIAAISLATGFPTIASVGHSLINSFKNLLAVSIATDYEFEESKQVSFLDASSPRPPLPPAHSIPPTR
jgi:large subunit ribosomal protein LP0